jgi:hypothetical protein
MHLKQPYDDRRVLGGQQPPLGLSPQAAVGGYGLGGFDT